MKKLTTFNSIDLKIVYRKIPLLSTLFILLISNPLSSKNLAVGDMVVSKDFKQNTIIGKIVDKNGAPIPGATIQEKGTNNTTSSDIDGNYAINVSSNAVIIIIRIIGHKTVEVKATNASLITMEIEDNSLEEVIVVGYGTQKRKDLTGAVDQIGAEAIGNRPTTSFGQTMQGLIPNLNVGIANGNPSTNASFNVRGTTSIVWNTSTSAFESSLGSPLILVDGVTGDVNNINPEDIETVTVLKDAASASIYGARAAFGVILITTKSGKSGRSQIDYSNSFQWSSPTAIPNILDAKTIQEGIIGAYANRGLSVPTNEELKLEKIIEYMNDPVNVDPYFMNGNSIVWVGNVNPYEEGLAKSAPMQKHNLSISGGNENTTYYGSFGFQNQDGIYKINTDNLKRINANLNVSSQINNYFKIDFRTQYNNSTYNEPRSPVGKGGWWTAMSQDPGRNVNMPMKTPEDSPVGVMYTDNILSFMDYGATEGENISNLILTASPRITILPQWSVQADISYKNYELDNKQFVPLLTRVENSWTSFTNVHTNPSYVSRYNAQSNQYTINIFSDYSKTIAKDHNLRAMLGFNQEWYTDFYTDASRQDVNPNIPTMSQAQGVQTVTDGESHWAIRAMFYRLTYDYKGKYLIQSNGRYDGTSRFGTEDRFAFFPTVSAGWVVSEEEFASNWNPYVSFFKLRGSYGSLGNQNVPNYSYLLYYNTQSNLAYLFNGVRTLYVQPPGLVDPNLTWETATSANIGVDFQLFNKWDFTFDWYSRTTSDILAPAEQLPATLGANVPLSNSGEIQTQGWEFSTTYRNKTNFGLSYDFRLTLSDYKSKVNNFNGNDNKLLSQFYDGMNIGQIWGFETYGLFQTQEEIDNAPKQTKISSSIWYPGYVRYTDLNGDGEISTGTNNVNDPGDRKVIGNSTPRYQYGFTTNLNYKGFDFNLFIQGVGKRDLWISNNLFWGAGTTGTYEVYNDSWTPENTDAYYPIYVNAGQNRNVQTRYLQNGAYLRIKNIALGYTIPKEVTEKMYFKKLRIFTSAFDLLEFKSVPDTFDPELTGMDYPIMRSYAFGIQASF
ncbi:SusC/RagA family TonB-linked outer membrane protein [Sphingobacterium hungaricum]|uniref:SusC/RagA family TonB-linked outer membrane protein n=1 Tax=Sphingobacterium hungaricum TaxID=2082723 RepID=A0A928V0U3_9SPHI|nr:TonB-dependent receptor [Sphingobacterium hungaricum]MBE8715040.1 SusC/RagA family TonB-linked outer membrane protein [Sphingobacterium hungaricum]